MFWYPSPKGPMNSRPNGRLIETGAASGRAAAVLAALLLCGCGGSVEPVEDIRIPDHQATRPVRRLQKQCVKMHERINKIDNDLSRMRGKLEGQADV